MGSYNKGDDLLGDNEKVVLPGNNTELVQTYDPFDPEADDAIAVKYHDTNVVTYQACGDVVYNHGGWETFTSARRMTEYGRDGVRVEFRGGRLWLTVEGAGAGVAFEGNAVLVRRDNVIEQLPHF